MIEHACPFLSSNSYRKRLWCGIDQIEKEIRNVILPSSKLLRETVKMNVSNEVWVCIKHKLKGFVLYEERMPKKKGMFYAPYFSLVLAMIMING